MSLPNIDILSTWGESILNDYPVASNWLIPFAVTLATINQLQ